MRLGLLLIATTGAFLLSSAACAGGARGGGGEAVADRADKPAPQREREQARPWRVRWSAHILEKHFDDDQFEVHASEHFVMLHDTDVERASVRAELLDRTHDRFFAAFGEFCELEPLDQPLICVLFAERDDFAHYARRVDWVDMSWSGGYYSSRTNRMALYDSKPARREVVVDADAPADGEAREAASGEAGEDENGEQSADEPEIVLLSSADEAGASATPRMNVASTTHEAAHQLAFNSGLQKRGVMYPLWVSEGLACAFETNAFGEPFGLGKINPSRLTDLRIAMGQGRLVELRELVAMTRPPVDDTTQLYAVYAQAWTLYRFLYLEQREALGAYMDELSRMPKGRRSKARLRGEFIEAFGSMDEMQARWSAHLKSLR